MSEESKMKVVCEKAIGGQTRLVSGATTQGPDQAEKILRMVGAGNPFFAWDTVPTGKIVGCDFSQAPLCGETIEAVRDQIASINARPEDVLTFA